MVIKKLGQKKCKKLALFDFARLCAKYSNLPLYTKAYVFFRIWNINNTKGAGLIVTDRIRRLSLFGRSVREAEGGRCLFLGSCLTSLSTESFYAFLSCWRLEVLQKFKLTEKCSGTLWIQSRGIQEADRADMYRSGCVISFSRGQSVCY